MSRRITVAILACLTGLWWATASAQDKIPPSPITPPPIIPNPALIKPPLLPADGVGGLLGDRVRQGSEAARDAAEAGRLQKELGLDAARGAGLPTDPLMGGAGIQAVGPDPFFSERCKDASSRRLLKGLGFCAGSDDGALPSDGDLSGFYNTKRPGPSSTDPGGTFSFEGPSAGGRVPSRDDRARDDDQKDQTREIGPDGAIHDSWTDREGRRHDLWISGDGGDALHEVHNSDGTFDYSAQTHLTPSHNGNYFRETTYTAGRNGRQWHTTERCHNDRCRSFQPGEPGYGQMKARAWFCSRNPKASQCEPTAPGSQIDPANPDGEGTSSARPHAETPRLGRGAVINPGPADSEIRGTTGGGSGPLDMKDPVNPGRPK